jgi:hypothetical protein
MTPNSLTVYVENPAKAGGRLSGFIIIPMSKDTELPKDIHIDRNSACVTWVLLEETGVEAKSTWHSLPMAFQGGKGG